MEKKRHLVLYRRRFFLLSFFSMSIGAYGKKVVLYFRVTSRIIMKSGIIYFESAKVDICYFVTDKRV